MTGHVSFNCLGNISSGIPNIGANAITNAAANINIDNVIVTLSIFD